MMMRAVPIVLFALLLTQFAQSQELARIYVYAQRETPARSWRLILCDGVAVAKIRRGTFFALNVQPGRHVLSDNQGIPAFVDAQAGGESFVRLDWQFETGESATLVLVTVPANVARNEMRFVSYIEPKKALSGSVPNADPRATPTLSLKSRDDH